MSPNIAMHFAERELNLPPAKKRLNDKVKAIKKS